MTRYNLINYWGELTKIHSQTDSTFGDEIRINQTFKTFQTDGSGTIEYRLNEHGYRSDENYYELIKENSSIKYILCLGCSHTEGIGVDVNKRWSEVLGKKLGLKVMNLGLTSASEVWNQFCWSNLDFMRPHLNEPMYICSLQPPNRRLTVMGGNRVTFFQDFNWKTNASDGTLSYHSIPEDKTWEIIEPHEDTKDNQHINDFYYNTFDLGWKSICKSEGIINLDWHVLGEEYPVAADGMHFGDKWHKEIADLFYKEIMEKKSAI